MMRSPLSSCLALLAVFAGFEVSAWANDSQFSPQPVAQSTINFDGLGYTINGQRVFIASAGMEYARVPRELWADRLMRIKREGFNCVEMYVLWNYHEAESGQFNFSDNRDLDAYLALVQSMGLYAIVRVGPYSCAEWDSGGYPIWLRFVPNLEVRNGNTVFQQYVVRWFEQLLPIVISHQIDRGGNVILVQLENEGPYGWGTDGASSYYYAYLQSTALAAGLEVPYLFSGNHHETSPGTNPLSRADMQVPPTPWFSTEFYTGWINLYGPSANPQAEVRNTWQVIAYGGNGYNHYMAEGGSNFDYFNNDEVASSYDYGSPLGEAGELRPEYYLFRRAAWFARGFQTILEQSTDATSTYAQAASNKSVVVTARQAPTGTILFVDDHGTAAQQTTVSVGGTQYPRGGSLTLNPDEILPIVTNYTLLSGVTLNVAPTRVLGISQQASTTTMVIYGQAGSPAELDFTVPAGASISAGAPALSLNGTSLSLQTTFPQSGAAVYSFQVGGQEVRILAVNDVWVNNTWFVDAGSENFVVVGPQYVGAASIVNGYLQIQTEVPYENPTSFPVTAYGAADTPISLNALSTPPAHPGNASLSAWQTMSGIQQAQPGYSTAGWLTSTTGPQQMGADGDVSAYAWYRTTVDVPATEPCIFSAEYMGDTMEAFVDGVAVSSPDYFFGSNLATTLPAGNHTLAVATIHNGRNKFLAYQGPITEMYPKGISGPTTLLLGATPVPATIAQAFAPIYVTGWKVQPTTSAAVGTAPPAPTAPGWTSYNVGSDAFSGQPGYAWFQTTLPTESASVSQVVANFGSVSDNCWVYLNGVQVQTHQGTGTAFAAGLSAAWNPGGTNVLSLLVQDTGGTGGIERGVTVTGYQGAAVPLANWVTKTTTSAAVGTTPPATTAAGWTNYTPGNDAFAGQPGYAWFQTTLPSLSSGLGYFATFNSIDDNGWIYLNGTLLTNHQGWNFPFLVDLSRAWNASGPNVLSILVQNTNGPGGIYGAADLSVCQSTVALNNWSQQGGPGNPNATTGWQPLAASATFSGPQFFSTTFTASPPAGDGTSPMWRVVTPASGNGSVWVNGHNLGRYPQKVAGVPGVFVPECWLNSGANANTLTIYDFNGVRPDAVEVFADPEAGRDITSYRSTNVIPVPIAQWRLNYFGANANNAAIAGDLANPSGDGLDNLLDYALGLSPLVNNPNPIVADTEVVAGQTYLRLTAPKNPAAVNVTYSVQAAGTLTMPAAWSSADVVVEVNTATELVARDSVPMGQASTRYLHLQVTGP